MSYPLVKELAADGIPVAVTCRVLKLARQPYYRWLASPVTALELRQAHLANALFDAHRDDPEFGHRLLADEAGQAGAGQQACDRTVWAICSANGWWSVFGKKRGKNGKKPGPPAHDDLVERDFSAAKVNELWLTDITEHTTAWIPAVVATPATRSGKCRRRQDLPLRHQRRLLKSHCRLLHQRPDGSLSCGRRVALSGPATRR